MKTEINNVNFSRLATDSAKDEVLANIQSSNYFFALPFNLRHFKRLKSGDKILKKMVSKAEYIFADGMPIVWASKIAGNSLPGRVTGCDFGKALIESSNGLKVFLLATNDDDSARIGEQAAEKFYSQGLNVKGLTQKYQDTLEKNITQKAEQILKKWKPDIVMVGLGGREQEEWILKNQQKYQIPFCMGVGGSIDIWAGYRKRAPLWMQKIGLEWFYQIINSPKKIKRYLSQLPIFVKLVLISIKKRFSHEK